MTALLEKAIAELKSMPKEKQDFMAAFILERMEEDWDEQMKEDFAPGGKLAWMLEEALNDLREGRTVEGGFLG